MRTHTFPKRIRILTCLTAFLSLLSLATAVLFPQGLSLGLPEYALQFFRQVQSDRRFNNELVHASSDMLAVGDQLLMMDGPLINLYGAGHSPQRILNTAKLHTYIDQLYCLWPHLYFSNWSSETSTLYEYHLETQELQELCQVPSCRFWAVSGNAFIYLAHMPFSEQDHAPLHIRDLRTGEDRQVSAAVSSFGLVEGELRYVSFREADDCYDVYRYDEKQNVSLPLGSFPALMGKNCLFQFCPDKIVMARYGNEIFNFDYRRRDATKLAVYDLKADSIVSYPLPSELQQLNAAEHYAYLLLYNTVGGGGYGVYRMDLENGEMKEITPKGEVGGVTILWAESDKRAYIMEFHGFSNARGALHRYDAEQDQTEFLCWID